MVYNESGISGKELFTTFIICPVCHHDQATTNPHEYKFRCGRCNHYKGTT